MLLLKHSRLAAFATRPHVARTDLRRASRIAVPFQQPAFPVVEFCPSPTCPCRESPAGLDIDRETMLNGSIGTYAEQVLIATGRSDWKSRIEEDEDAVLLQQIKGLLGRGGKYSDPYHNVLLTHSSFPPASKPSKSKNNLTLPVNIDKSETSQVAVSHPASAYLVPSFQYVPAIPTDADSVDAFVRAFILPQKLHHAHERLSREEQNILRREDEKQRQFVGVRPVQEILVLICGHGGRDERCGIYGPLLQAEFEDQLQRQNISLLEESPKAENVEAAESHVTASELTARVGLISHIGGHKFAGNVIIYIPPTFSQNALAGKGIWYGRVGPEQVEGVVAKTILGGKVIKDLFRGGIDQSGDPLRL